ncbi:hypothetical protein [Marinobacter arenosus]|uniref:hypothetical protein n=1 Tax=Marinobacter arenosus TaxID=2856822 RepID=UPI001C4CC7B4|nr:hypothetical protein [Marinobacter arenosus]MBW0147227.1 hypothetical protein [Marinobacter arenosus]
MSDPFSLLVGTAALAAAASSISATAIQAFDSIRDRKRKLREARAKRLETVLEANDLDALGAFLDETIGEFNVAEYTVNRDVAQTIDKYLTGLVDFLGTDEEVEKAEEATSNVTSQFGELKFTRKAPQGPMSKVVSELEAGEVWNALSRLRREVEIRLRKFATEHGFKDRHLKSAGQVLRILSEREYISANLAERLSYSIAICNRAVHGRDVSFDEARKAYLTAEQALDAVGA